MNPRQFNSSPRQAGAQQAAVYGAAPGDAQAGGYLSLSQPGDIDASAQYGSDADINSPGWESAGAVHLKRERCTYPGCGRLFKDLKAHMRSHQDERPEKCPIETCEYHTKGFSRKYDRLRHTLMHYKGTMVCGFCPGADTAAEVTFNRLDLFKKHLLASHGVKPPPSNSRKGASVTGDGFQAGVSGKCSICLRVFGDVGEFYNHLDECVLAVVQQVDPAEVINAQRLAEVENDSEVNASLERANLPIPTEATTTDDGMDIDEEDTPSAGHASSTTPTKDKRRGSTLQGQPTDSKDETSGAVPRRRRNKGGYPSSWGFGQGQMTMKKRIMTVFDGPTRVGEDDMVLSTDHEVRVKLSDGKSYVTDFDVQTLNLAEKFFNANETERPPWGVDDPTQEQLQELHTMLEGPAMPED